MSRSLERNNFDKPPLPLNQAPLYCLSPTPPSDPPSSYDRTVSNTSSRFILKYFKSGKRNSFEERCVPNIPIRKESLDRRPCSEKLITKSNGVIQKTRFVSLKTFQLK